MKKYWLFLVLLSGCAHDPSSKSCDIVQVKKIISCRVSTMCENFCKVELDTGFNARICDAVVGRKYSTCSIKLVDPPVTHELEERGSTR